ncbi:hypothetical protein HMPREF9120_02053 [Neisseria sp. oral taxon 020 str. F0370]|nr:hypothetical protein HMPREF9120_02053 [Neisseria sp. oral taxon 020 str. F0370]
MLLDTAWLDETKGRLKTCNPVFRRPFQRQHVGARIQSGAKKEAV